MTALAAALLITFQTPQAARYDMGERLKALESAWMSASKESKAKAVTPITQSVMSFFSGSFGSASRSLDEGRAMLMGRGLRPSDALTFRQKPSSYSLGKEVVIGGWWTYPVESRVIQPIVIQSGSLKVNPTANTPFEFAVRVSENDLAKGALTIIVDGEARSIVLSHLPSLEQRVKRLEESSSPSIRPILDLIDAQTSGRSETDLPLAPALSLAEDLAEGRINAKNVKSWPLAKQGQTYLRASFPDVLDSSETLVIALHGAGGSENLFYEGYGLGLAVRETLKRGWVFTSPRSGPSAAKDVLQWLKEVRGWTPKRIVVMGHSMGGALALQSGTLDPKPSAVVLFAPAGRSVPPALAGTPVFLAVGRQEIMMLGASAQSLKNQLDGTDGFQRLLADPCEHLMIVAEALPEAFPWLDRTLKR